MIWGSPYFKQPPYPWYATSHGAQEAVQPPPTKLGTPVNRFDRILLPTQRGLQAEAVLNGSVNYPDRNRSNYQ